MRVLLEMKRQISWQEQDLNIRSQDLNQPAASQLEVPRKRSGTGRTETIKNIGNPQQDKQKSQKILGIHNWTQTGIGTYTRALCQKNEECVEIKQRSTKMCGRNIYRTLSPNRTRIQTGIYR
jgi:hypothetical protein